MQSHSRRRVCRKVRAGSIEFFIYQHIIESFAYKNVKENFFGTVLKENVNQLLKHELIRFKFKTYTRAVDIARSINVDEGAVFRVRNIKVLSEFQIRNATWPPFCRILFTLPCFYGTPFLKNSEFHKLLKLQCHYLSL